VEDHFSTWIRKIGGEAKWFEHVTFSRLGATTFDRLLFASAESPAMLLYLDQTRSYVGSLNENYARELMELHTLGVDGGYVQADVTNLAHLLTGWTASLDGDGRSGGTAALRYTFRFDPDLNDSESTDVFGIGFPAAESIDSYDRAVLAVEHLASHPQTARHIARKLAEHYVSAPAPDDLVERLANVFLATGGDMTDMLKALSNAPALWASTPAARVAQPFEYVIRLSRVAGVDDPLAAARFLTISGQGLFDRPTPDGYPEEDTAYVDSNALIQRWRLAVNLTDELATLVPAPWRKTRDAVGATWTTETAGGWDQAVVDVIAARLTGRVLSAASNAAALEVIAAGEGSLDDKVRVIAPFIAQLPEANLR
jgi:uncharacterized protein (DUF1800 family)